MTMAAEEAAPEVRSQRMYFVDLLKLIASFQMVHGHTLDAVMADHLRSGTLYDRWSWCRGLVSVGFLFAAGIAFHLSTLTRLPAHLADRDKRFVRWKRIAITVLWGYLLNFPDGIFSGDPARAIESLHRFAEVGVLQCIGLAVLVLEILSSILRNPRRVVIASAAITAVLFAIAPLGERLDPSGFWRPLANYATHDGGSLFPMIPHAGYVFAGVVLAEIALPEGSRTRPDVPPVRLAIVASLTLALAWLVSMAPFTLVDEATSGNSRPAFNVLKLGVMCGLCTLLAIAGRRIRKLPRFLSILAGETLFLFVSHLLILYVTGVGLYHWLGHRLELGPAIALATSMVLVVGALGLGWNRLKEWRGNTARKAA